MGNFFDLYDIFLGGVLAAVLAEQWGLSTSGKALCISSGFAGMFFGAALLGTLADRLGRRRTFLMEILPRQVRGRYMATAYTLSFFGVPLAAFIGARFVAGEHLLVDGWRWLLVIGSLGALVVFAMRRSLPESPRWHEIRGDHESADRAARTIEDAACEELGVEELPEPEPVEVARADKASVRDIFTPPYGRRSLMLWIFQFLQTVGYYGFGTLAPLVLKSKGYDIVESLGFTALIYLGYPAGSALSVPLMERFERKHLIVGSALAIGLFGMAFGFAGAPWLIVVAGFLTTSVSNVFSNSFHIYQAEIFPTRMRGTAVGIAYSLSRLSGAILPFISVTVLDNLGADAVFAGSFAIMVVVALDVALLGPRSTGLVLEDSASEVRSRAAAASGSPAG